MPHKLQTKGWAKTTLGEIADAMRAVFGEHREIDA